MLALLFTFLSFFQNAGNELQIAEDLQPRWKVLNDGNFVPYNGSANVIHLSIDLNKETNYFLEIQSKKEFYLFANSSLIIKSSHVVLKADSLKKIFGPSFFLSLYQPHGTAHLSTKWVFQKKDDQYDNIPRQSNSFNNFVLMSVLLLIIFFTTLLRNNPQLTLDYLNIIKLFSLKRRDDSQFVLRITSSVNLLFYFFCSLLTSLALIIAIHYSNSVSISFQTDYSSVSNYFGLWILISLIIGGFLMTKLGLASAVSALFGWRDTAGFQFFNFIRVLVISLSIIGILSVLCFWMNINVDYYFLVKCFCTMLTLGVILMFFKLLNRESTGSFHLFSYLCATEILPLVILIKVFLF